MYSTPRRGVRRRLNYSTPARPSTRQAGRTPRRSQQLLRSRGSKLTSKNALSKLKVENKYYDTYKEGSTVSHLIAAAQQDPGNGIGCLFAPVEGDGESDREGLHVVINKLSIQGQIEFKGQTDALTAASYVRIAIVLERQTNGTTWSGAKSAQVWKSPRNGSNIPASIVEALAFRNMQETSRFQVLKEFYVVRPNVNATSEGAAANQARSTSTFVPFECHMDMQLEVKFRDGTTEAVSSISDNSLHVLALAEPNDTANDAEITYAARVRYFG